MNFIENILTRCDNLQELQALTELVVNSTLSNRQLKALSACLLRKINQLVYINLILNETVAVLAGKDNKFEVSFDLQGLKNPRIQYEVKGSIVNVKGELPYAH